MNVWDWDSGALNMGLDKRAVKSMYSPLAIFSWILVGMGGKVGWGNDGIGSNVGTPDKQGELTCVEECVGRTCVGRGWLDCTCREAADRRSSSIASGCGVTKCVALFLAC